MLWHGMQKLFGFPPSSGGGGGGALMTVAGIIEFGGGLLLILGLFTRPAAFLLSGLMAVAYFMAHAPGGFFADCQQRRTCRDLLFCLLLSVFRRRRRVEFRQIDLEEKLSFMKNYVEKAMPYAEYIEMIDDLLAEGKTTGQNQSEAMFNYGKLNRQRMKRLAISVEINESLAEKARNIKQKMDLADNHRRLVRRRGAEYSDH